MNSSKYQTPVIVRMNEHGNPVALFPTMPASFSDTSLCVRANSRGDISGGESVAVFMARTSKASYRTIEKYIKNIQITGHFKAVDEATPAMDKQRRSSYMLNPENQAQDL